MEEVRLVPFHACAIHRPEELTRKLSRTSQNVAIDIGSDRHFSYFDVHFERKALACMDDRKFIIPEGREGSLCEQTQRRQSVHLYYR